MNTRVLPITDKVDVATHVLNLDRIHEAETQIMLALKHMKCLPVEVEALTGLLMQTREDIKTKLLQQTVA